MYSFLDPMNCQEHKRYYFHCLLSRFPLYLRKKAQDAAAIAAIKKKFVF